MYVLVVDFVLGGIVVFFKIKFHVTKSDAALMM